MALILFLFLTMNIAAVVQSPQEALTMADFSGVGRALNNADVGQDAETFQGGSGPGYRNRGFGGNEPIRRNRYNPVVQKIQSMLVEAGVLSRPNSTNGVMDDQTQTVIEEAVGADIEQVSDMPEEEVEQKVSNYLENYDPQNKVSAPDTENYNPRTERVQRRLNNLGMGIDVDGYHGEQTSEAIRRWQAAAGYEPTGVLTESQNNNLATDSMTGGTRELRDQLGLEGRHGDRPRD